MINMDVTNGGDWTKWSKHVLIEIVRLNECYTTLYKDMNKLQIEIASLKIENKMKQRFSASAWGLIGAIIPTLIMIFYLIHSAGG